MRGDNVIQSPSSHPESERTGVVLARVRAGEPGASDELLGLLYGELRSLAGNILRPEAAGHTLQPTALVHEAYMRLMGPSSQPFENRAHFFGAAARAMRRVLIDHARARDALKRGGARDRVTLVEEGTPNGTAEVDLLALDESLAKLEQLNERHCRVVELRYFAGLSFEQCAQVMGVSKRTVELDWRMARAWLFAELQA